MQSLYDDAELYDLVAPVDPQMERFYVETAGGSGRRVLDLACGSGRFTAPLAASGALVTGGDLSEVMLARARAALSEARLAAELVQLDMREFALEGQFDRIVVAANSLLHLTSHDDFARAFSSIRRHLAPGGRFVFDVFVPSAHLLSRPAGERQPLGRFTHARLGEVAIEETIAYDPVTQVSRANWYWSTPENPGFRQTRLELRQIYPQELPLLLSLGGLRLDQRFGGFDRSPLAANSMRQVCIAMAG
jgi:SAM-dependent methyltransferase